MAVEAEAEIILSDNDDDDCILEAVTFDVSLKKRNNNVLYDYVFNENPLLAEMIERCLQLENSDGMHRIINKTLLEVYKKADPEYKSSKDFESALKKTLINLDKDPKHKFSHIKHLCDLLRYNGKKKRAKLITLDKNVKRKAFEELGRKRKSVLERRNKKQKTDVIDLDKYEVHSFEVPIINLDQMDTPDQDSPIVIDDEKENQSSQENSDCCIEICDELDENSQNLSSESNTIPSIVNHTDISKNTEVLSEKEQQSEIHRDKEIKEYCEENNCTLVQNAENQNQSLNSPEKLLVPQAVLDLTDDIDSIKAFVVCEKEERIKKIEKDIAQCKELIVALDEKEVTVDTCFSPYVQSEKYKEKIVSLYKELCQLTGTETTKRREVRLKAMEGHPPGPVERLQRFLNRNIGEDGHPPFPDFSDVLKCVSVANEKDNLGWSKGQIMREASLLFAHCGRALQRRRQQREWRDLMARVDAEHCAGDPADSDPELLARLEANRRLGIKKESDLLQRYTLMQLLPPEKKTSAITPSPVDNLIQDESLNGSNSTQSNCYGNNVIGPTKENMPNHNEKITANQNIITFNNELTNNTPNYLIQNGELGMPKIIPESIKNITYSDHYGLPKNKSKVISNDEINHLNCSIVNFVVNVENNNIDCNSAANNIDVPSEKVEENDGKDNSKSHSTINFDTINDPKQVSNVEINRDYLAEKFGIYLVKGGNNINSNETANNTNVPRLKFEPSDDQIKPDNGVINIKTEIPRLKPVSNIETVLNTDANIESNSVAESSIVVSVKTEADIKTDPTENIVKRLEEFGDNYKVSIFDFEDPFLVVEISDTSDEEEV